MQCKEQARDPSPLDLFPPDWPKRSAADGNPQASYFVPGGFVNVDRRHGASREKSASGSPFLFGPALCCRQGNQGRLKLSSALMTPATGWPLPRKEIRERQAVTNEELRLPAESDGLGPSTYRVPAVNF